MPKLPPSKPRRKRVNLHARQFALLPTDAWRLLPRSTVAVLHCMICYANRYHYVYVKYETIMEFSGVRGRSQISNALKLLVDGGWIGEKKRRHNNSTVYKILAFESPKIGLCKVPKTGRSLKSQNRTDFLEGKSQNMDANNMGLSPSVPGSLSDFAPDERSMNGTNGDDEFIPDCDR